MRIAVAIGALLVSARPAAACYPAFTRAIVGAPTFEPADAVKVTGETVDVTCDEHYACTVTSTYAIAVTQPARATVTGHDTPVLGLRVERSPLAVTGETPTVELVPGDSELTLHARAELPMYVDDCFTDGVIARHPYLASPRSNNQRVLQIDTTATPRVNHPASWDLTVDTRDATKYDRATTRLWFDVPGRLVTHGGPVLLVGAASDVGQTQRIRAGWEAAIGRPWLVFGLFGDTDFVDTWTVALTAEPTTRAWMLPISFSAGGGVVVGNGSRVGGRGQLSIALGPARVVLSIDVTRADGAVDTSVAGFVGGSL